MIMKTAANLVSAEAPLDNSRRYQRLPVDVLVQVCTEAPRIADRARDLSEGGVRVETTCPLPPQTQVRIKLELPHVDGMLDVKGRVVWSDHTAMGIGFENVDTQVADSIDRLRADFDRI
jgi:hypothetical protein